jgi:hypothetical protein
MAGDEHASYYKPLVSLINGPECSVVNALAAESRQTCYIKRVSWDPVSDWGGFADIDQVKAKIEGLDANSDGTLVIVDETDLVWYGDDWRGESISLDRKWLDKMTIAGYDVWVVTGVASAWAGEGFNAGWAVAPSQKSPNPFGTQTISSLALAFVTAAFMDDGYYLDTQRVFVEKIRKDMVERATLDGLDVWGPPFLPVIFVDLGSSKALLAFLNLARSQGFVLEGSSKSSGDSYLQIAVHVLHSRVFDLLCDFLKKPNSKEESKKASNKKTGKAKQGLRRCTEPTSAQKKGL